MHSAEHVHQGQPCLTAGVDRDTARAAVLLLHGRGASAHDILQFATELVPIDQGQVLYLAPQAARHSWYPQRFLAPLASNEPWLSSALAVIGGLLDALAADGISPQRTLLLGFSQGACLVMEYASRNPRRYGGIVGLSGGLLGADDDPRHTTGSLEGTPVFIGCGDTDMHIPEYRVHHAAATLEALHGAVTKRIYPNMGHTVNQDELDFVRSMLTTLLEQG
jgi:predicted esterase